MTMNTNNLDSVWAAMTTADRIVLLGHDRPELAAEDRARLNRLLSETVAQRNAPTPTTGRPGRGPRTSRNTRGDEQPHSGPRRQPSGR